MNDEPKPAELTDDDLESVAGGYNWTHMYKKDETIELYCTGCDEITTLVCTSATTKKGNSWKGWDYETSWVCTNCSSGQPYRCHKNPW